MITVIVEVPGGTTATYDAVRQAVNVVGDPPEGCIFHCASVTESGILIADVWETEEAFRRFATERLVPVQRQFGVSAEPRIYATHDVMGAGIPTPA